MIEFGVLGPLTVRLNGTPVAVNAAMRRQLLAVLLCRAGQPIPVPAVMAALWGPGPPPTARKTLQAYVYRLRKELDHAERITHGPAGYTILAAPAELDALRLAELAGQARGAVRQGEPERASDLYGRALSLWRGTPYTDIPADLMVADEVRRLERQRLLILEERCAVDLGLGRHAGLTSELLDLVRAHPYREGLRGHLMLALYRAGRRAEALEVFRDARVLLRDELGVDPGPDLQRLHEALLRDDEQLMAFGTERAVILPERPSPYGVPRELPADVQGFCGRDEALKALDELLPNGDHDEVPGPVVVSAIAGAAGVGKTALAVHWAHRVAGRFPDGQLYVNLRGYDPGPPMRPLDALAAFLRALGLPADQVPADLAEAAARFRSLAADRRLLVVLDNAGSAQQVRPLLPGSPGCLVLVTSRDRLTGLIARDGARRLTLNVLDQAKAGDLLCRLVGADRIHAEPAAATALARECGYLPLALRIAAAYLADQPHHQIAAYVQALQTGNPITALSVDGDPDSAVRAAFDLSYTKLTPPAQRLFRLFGLVPCDDFDITAAAVLTALPEPDTTPLVAELTDAHLIEWSSSARFSLHDLLRRYAATLAHAHESTPDRSAAMRRLFTWTRSTTTGPPPYPGYRGCPRSTACRQWA